MDIETARIIGLEKSKEIVEKIEIRKKHSPNLGQHNWFLEILHSIAKGELGSLRVSKVDVNITRELVTIEYDSEPLTNTEILRFTTGWYSWQISMHTEAIYATITSPSEGKTGEPDGMYTSINIRSERNGNVSGKVSKSLMSINSKEIGNSKKTKIVVQSQANMRDEFAKVADELLKDPTPLIFLGLRRLSITIDGKGNQIVKHNFLKQVDGNYGDGLTIRSIHHSTEDKEIDISHSILEYTGEHYTISVPAERVMYQPTPLKAIPIGQLPKIVQGAPAYVKDEGKLMSNLPFIVSIPEVISQTKNPYSIKHRRDSDNLTKIWWHNDSIEQVVRLPELCMDYKEFIKQTNHILANKKELINELEVDSPLKQIFERIYNENTSYPDQWAESINDLGACKAHVFTCLKILEELIPDSRTKGKIWKTLLNHDIGYESRHNGIKDPNISGFMVTSPADDINSKAILMHGKMENFSKFERGLDTLETLIIDYCNIHSSYIGKRCTIEERYDEIARKHSGLPEHMENQKNYYLMLDEHIGTIIENYLEVLNNKK